MLSAEWLPQDRWRSWLGGIAGCNLSLLLSTQYSALSTSLERAPEALVPRLWGGHSDEGVLAIAGVQVQVGEELQLG